MPPPGIPAWLFPGIILQRNDEPGVYAWVEAVSLTPRGTVGVTVRPVHTVDPLRVQSMSDVVPLARILDIFEPWQPNEYAGNQWVMQPQRSYHSERLGDGLGEALLGHATPEMASPPDESRDDVLDIVPLDVLDYGVAERQIRILSTLRESPLGGFAVFIQQDGPGVSVLDRGAGLGGLLLQHDEIRGIRVVRADTESDPPGPLQSALEASSVIRDSLRGQDPAEQWPPPVEGTDGGLPVISNHSLVTSVQDGVIRVVSRPRISPLGGIAIVIQNESTSASIYINRDDLSMIPLHIGADTTMGVRVLTNVEIARGRHIDLPTPESVEQANEALRAFAEAHAGGRVSRARLLGAINHLQELAHARFDADREEDPDFERPIPEVIRPGVVHQVGTPHPIRLIRTPLASEEDLQRIATWVRENPNAGGVTTGSEVEYTPPLRPGTVLAVREHPEVIVGFVLSINTEYRPSTGRQETAEIQFAPNAPLLQGSRMTFRVQDLLRTLVPVPGNMLDAVQSMGSALGTTMNFMVAQFQGFAENLKAEAAKVRRTSFERLLQDDDDE